MIAIILGVLLIIFGCAWGFMNLLAAGMASRQVTKWEGTWRPFIWFAGPTVLGVALLVWG